MIGGEIFLPGGVLGFFGALTLIGAVITGYITFGPLTGTYIALLIILLVGLSIAAWLKFFPRTGLGRQMTLATDGKDFKAANRKYRELLNKEGVTLTELRPAGLARIEHTQYDVVTEGTLVDKNRPVRVIKVEGNRIVVRLIGEP